MKNKKGLIIILVIVVVLLVAGFFVYREIKTKQEKELAEQQYKQLAYDFNLLSDKTVVKYYSLELLIAIGFRSGVLNNIYKKTADYWGDYINYDVYGKSKSKYKLKTFDEVIKKRNSKYRDSIKMLEENREIALDTKKTLNSIDEHSDNDIINNKKIAINFIDAFIKIYDDVLIISNSYIGYKESFGRSVITYNKAYDELNSYASESTDYFDKYKKFVFDNKLNQYCDYDNAQTDGDKNSSMTYFQVCDNQIRQQFNLEQYNTDNGFISDISETNVDVTE